MNTPAAVDDQLEHLRGQLLRADNGPAVQYVTAVWNSIRQLRQTATSEDDLIHGTNKLLQQVAVFVHNPHQQIPESEQNALKEYYDTIAKSQLVIDDKIPPPMEDDRISGIQAADIKTAAIGMKSAPVMDLSMPSLDELEDVIMDLLDEEDEPEPDKVRSPISTSVDAINDGLWAEKTEIHVQHQQENTKSPSSRPSSPAYSGLEGSKPIATSPPRTPPAMNVPTHIISDDPDELSDDDCIVLPENPKPVDLPGTVPEGKPTEQQPQPESGAEKDVTTANDKTVNGSVVRTDDNSPPPKKKGCCVIM